MCLNTSEVSLTQNEDSALEIGVYHGIKVKKN